MTTKADILRAHIAAHQPISQKDLCKLMGWTGAEVGSYTRAMVKRGALLQDDQRRYSIGRPVNSRQGKKITDPAIKAERERERNRIRNEQRKAERHARGVIPRPKRTRAEIDRDQRLGEIAMAARAARNREMGLRDMPALESFETVEEFQARGGVVERLSTHWEAA